MKQSNFSMIPVVRYSEDEKMFEHGKNNFVMQ
jgi:hypothetical protein